MLFRSGRALPQVVGAAVRAQVNAGKVVKGWGRSQRALASVLGQRGAELLEEGPEAFPKSLLTGWAGRPWGRSICLVMAKEIRGAGVQTLN